MYKVIEWDIRSWCQWLNFPVGQHYEVTMSVHCHKSVPVLIGPHMLQGSTTLTTNISEKMSKTKPIAVCNFKHLLVASKKGFISYTTDNLSKTASQGIIFSLLLFYILATSTVISGRLPTCDSAHSQRLYSAAPLGDRATSTSEVISHSVTLSCPC